MANRPSVNVIAYRYDLLSEALAAIARGRLDGGRPLSGEAARQIARTTLVACGIDWSSQ